MVLDFWLQYQLPRCDQAICYIILDGFAFIDPLSLASF